MRILIDHSDHTLDNTGDIAMLQVSIERLRTLWPTATLDVVTRDPGHLAYHCPEVNPVGFSLLSSRMLKALPPLVWQKTHRLEGLVRQFDPGWGDMISRAQRKAGTKAIRPLDEALVVADMVVAAGGGYLADPFFWHADHVLSLLIKAHWLGKPIALFGQGLGPLHSKRLHNKLRYALSVAQQVSLREGTFSPELIQTLRIPTTHVLVTGDDAIELAYRGRAHSLGDAIGINLRMAQYSGIVEETLAQVRNVLQQVARDYQAPLCGIPIAHVTSRGQHADAETIAQLLTTYVDDPLVGARLNTPALTLERVGRCRVVVTGSYHGAVFALGQGISTICLARSTYYRQKFVGLANQFGAGCTVLTMDSPDWAQALERAIRSNWQDAERLRPALLLAADRQIQQSRQAYVSFARRLGAANPKQQDLVPAEGLKVANKDT